MVGAKIELHFDYLGKIKKYPSGYFLKKGTALTDAVTGSKSLTTHAASKRFKLRCTVVTREVQSQDLGLPLSAGLLLRAGSILTIQVRCKARGPTMR